MADQQSTIDALLPCPFCGESKNLYIEHLDGTVIHPAYSVRCDNCGASSEFTDKDCRAAWNTRASSNIDALLAEVEALRKRREWLPIESAPREGERILLLSKHGVRSGAWLGSKWEYDSWNSDGCGCCSEDDEPPTHWMPLPEPSK